MGGVATAAARAGFADLARWLDEPAPRAELARGLALLLVAAYPGSHFGYLDADIPIIAVAYLDGDEVGAIYLNTLPRDALDRACLASVQRLDARAGRRLGVLRVSEAELRAEARGRGVGVELYARAIEAAGELGCAVVADVCALPTDWTGGAPRQTSADARRVWASGRLAGRAIVDGLAAISRALAAPRRPNVGAPSRALPRAVTLFSGGGLVEEGLRGLVEPVAAVEASPAVGAHYARVHGPHVRVQDVRDVDLSDVAGADYLHASPVCKHYSTARVLTPDGEEPIDVLTAEATARAIREVRPRVFTLENVPAYAHSDAMRAITSALDAEGYTWDARVYDAADYGAATARRRLLLRAVRSGRLPPPPAPVGPRDWWAAARDLVPALPDATVPAWMAERLDAAGVAWRAPPRPLLVMGGSTSRSVPYAYAGGPAPTFKATPKERHLILLPNGEVKVVTPRVIARITGLRDTYPLPEGRELAVTVIGNGIPPALTRAVFGPLLR